MCGIAGTVGVADPAMVEGMCETLAHRGPDGHGVETFPRDGRGGVPAALGHRRLAIIDPTPAGAQPMSYADGRYWITYNGEIYNFAELRRGLEADGFSFRSDCDTEVLLAAYARRGPEMLAELNGIFAFAIWDAEAEQLFLARDPLGVKPLAYSQRDGRLYFASEASAIVGASGTAAVDEQALASYLTFLWIPDPATMLRDVHKLPPGHCATYRDGRLDVRSWFDPGFDPDPSRTEESFIEEVRETVQAAVRRQMVSDVPLGAFLSGGVDSGAVVATMVQDVPDVDTYTVGWTSGDLSHEISHDDLPWARRLGAQLGVDYHEQILKPDIVELLPQLIGHMDEPIADPAAITTYLICSAARERLTVILSGVGGDEVFAGYPRHLAMKFAGSLDWLPRSWRSRLRRASEGRLTMGGPGRMRGPRRNLMKFLRGIDQTPIDRYLTYSSYYRSDELPGLLSDDLDSSLAGYDPFGVHHAHAAEVAGEHWLDQLLYLDQKTFLPCLNLAYTDRMSMAASTEVRVPLIDDEVVRVASRIPADLKLRGRNRKWVFKKAMEGLLPNDVIWRPKAGFGAPVRAWVEGPMQPLIDELLSPETIRSRGQLDPAAVARIRADNRSGQADNALRIWALLVLELWQRQFIDAA
jgi:asparagine synthase (glutamine-hydrolysing)